MPFTSTLDPVLFNIGPLSVRYYGLVYALGFLFAIWYSKWMRKKGILEMSDDDIYDAVFYMMLGVLIGGRLFSTLVWYPSYYLKNPLEILMVWKGGMAFHGGLIGVLIAAWWISREKNIPIGRLLDFYSMPFVFFLGIGRLANFANGELYGPVTSVPWCVNFPGVAGCRHPYQIYSAIKRFLMVPILIWAFRRPHKDGFVFVLMTFFFGVGRFALDFWREDVLYIGISIGQWSSVVVTALTIYVAVRYFREDVKCLFHRTKSAHTAVTNE